jgi:bifunctional DNA-binding transcriptional regulator/antitoxin component of YhaV-PrlF toxin-antitoxin module
VASGWECHFQQVVQFGRIVADTPIRVRLGPQGRLVVPVELHRELGLEEGTEMAVRSDGRRLILEPRAEVLRRLRRRFGHVPEGVSLAEELAADRQEEPRRESAE